ncbi:MAG: S8 family serine peptidase, partial [Bacteroidia bacterium]
MSKRTFFLTVWVLISAIAFGQNENLGKPLYLKSGTKYLPKNIAELESADLSKHSINGVAWIILQFKDIPQPHQVQELEHNGIKLLAYLPKHSYLAQVVLPVNSKALQLSGARAFYLLQAEDKLENRIKTDSIPEHAIEGNNIKLLVHLVSSSYLDVFEQNLHQLEGNISIPNHSNSVVEISINRSSLQQLASLPYVIYIEPISSPLTSFNFFSVANTRTNLLRTVDLKEINGEGVKVAVFDGGYVAPHADFANRLINLTSERYNSYGSHGDHVSGTVGGAGNINPQMAGIAPKAIIYTQKSGFLLENAAYYYNNYEVTITNNSYGSRYPVYGQYNSISRKTDLLCNNKMKQLHVFASGNESFPGQFGHLYKRVVDGYQVSKNVLTVGNLNPFDSINPSSSRGPVLDGRIKPEIAAPGTSVASTVPNNTYGLKTGTSMASPAVAGAAALVTQAYKKRYNKIPESALLKNILCNTADDCGAPNPDFVYGFGRLNANKAVTLNQLGNFYRDSVQNNQTDESTITVANGQAQLKVMLTWNDPAAALIAHYDLVNDLDLELVDPNNNVVQAWVTDPDFLLTPTNGAVRGRDSLNNIEQVTIKNPTPGTWKIRVKGHNVASTRQ